MASTLIFGATGLVGSHIVQLLRAGSPSTFSSIEVVGRRPVPAATDAKVEVKEFVEKDTTKWVPHVAALSPSPTTLFSALATTRGAAGGFETQYKLEHDLNIELAKAAKAAGTKTYVLISAAGSNAKSSLAYVRMKGEIEEHVKEIDFDHTIIVRPGLIVGDRQESRPMEAIYRSIASGLGHLYSGLKDPWAQDADVIAKAAILAAMRVNSGEIKDKVVIVSQHDIIRLGKKEWSSLS